jgi:ligand-binding sensor domain-containing protein
MTRRLVQGVLSATLVLAALPASALDPERFITQYGHDVWTRQRGLPGEAVYEVVQTAESYLWLRTSSGLVRFDGVRFTEMSPRLDGSEAPEDVRAIALGAGGVLMARSATRTLQYEAGAFSAVGPASPLPEGVVRKLLETRDRRVFIGTDAGLYEAEGSEYWPVLGGAGRIAALLEDGKSLWIAAGGLHEYANGLVMHRSGNLSVTALAKDAQGRLWVGTHEGLFLFVRERGRLAEDALTRPLAGVPVTALLFDRDQNLWAGTRGRGLYRLAGRRWSSLVDGLSDPDVLSLAEDREGSLWIGTASGLDRLRDTPLKTFTTREGLAGNDVVSVAEAADGSVFVMSDVGGLTRLTPDGGVSTYSAREGLPSGYRGGSLFASRDGSVWIGTHMGLVRWKDGRLSTFTAGGALQGRYVSAIAEDDDGLIVTTSEKRIFRLRDNRLSELMVDGQPLALRSNLPEGAARRLLSKDDRAYVFTIHRDWHGALWFGVTTPSGVPSGLHKLGSAPGAGAAAQMAVDFSVKAIHEDPEGDLWLGGDCPGLVRFRPHDGQVFRYRGRDGLFDDPITRIQGDLDGNLWMSTPRGLFKVARHALVRRAEGDEAPLAVTAYGPLDGMRTAEAASPERQPAGLTTRKGELWFATRKGVVVVSPREVRRNEAPPPVRIEELAVGSESMPARPEIELPPGKDGWALRYTALSLLVPERVRFKYRLEGYDPDWVDADTRRVAYYTKVPPGRYQFRVMASNNDGVWNEHGDTIAIRLRPHFYQTRMFQALVVLAGVLLALGAHRLRMGHLRQRQAELDRKINEALASIRVLRGMLPVCAWCHKVRTDGGYWEKIEAYVSANSDTTFTHGICPDCSERVTPPEETDAPRKMS